MTELAEPIQEKLDVHMAYFHPEEQIFSVERQEEHMLKALETFAQAVDYNEEATQLRGAWFGRDKQEMYDILDQYIKL